MAWPLQKGWRGCCTSGKGSALNIDQEIVERLLDALSTSGPGQVSEILATELALILAAVAMEDRYQAGLQWLDQVDRRLQRAGVELPPLMYLQVLIRAGGDELDQTMLMPAGVQNLHAN